MQAVTAPVSPEQAYQPPANGRLYATVRARARTNVGPEVELTPVVRRRSKISLLRSAPHGEQSTIGEPD
jgi:hypothetical protein